MAKNTVDILLRHLGAQAPGQVVEEQADQHLLERFVRRRDETAFAALLERHGPMVLGVCRRALHDQHLAEEVFQATFLVLARNAGTIRKRPSLACWLHGVALRLARKARADAARARQGDARPAPEAPPDPAAEASWREVRRILDEELQRLPESYRQPLVLCYLEGRTRDEAAAELGWTPGRLKGLLERGRRRLHDRLIRRGLAPAALGVALLAETALAEPVPPLLAVATVHAALPLAAGEVLQARGVSGTVLGLAEGGAGITGPKKALLFLALVLALGALGTSAGLLARRPGSIPSPPAEPSPKEDKKPRTDLEKLQGTWQPVAREYNGKPVPSVGLDWWIFKDHSLTQLLGMSSIFSQFTLDPTRRPKQLTLITKVAPGQQVEVPCIYKLEGDRLTLCFDVESKGFKKRQPKEFTGKAGTGMTLLVLERVLPRGKAPPGQDKLKVDSETAWRKKETFKTVAPQPEDWWKPGGLFPAFVQFAPDGKRLEAGRMVNHGQGFALLDLATAKDLTARSISEDRAHECRFLGFTPDGRTWGFREVASGPALAGFAVVDWVSGRERCRITDKGRWRAALSPDGKVLAGINVDGKLMLWDAATGKALGSLASPPTDYFGFLAFSPDSKTLATAGFPRKRFALHVQDTPDDHLARLTLWDVATRKQQAGRTLKGEQADGLGMPSTPSGNESARSMRFTPDGRLAFACHVVLPGQPYPQTVLRILDVRGTRASRQFQSKEYGSLRDYALSPDGKSVAVAWMGAVVSQAPGQATVYAPAPVTILDLATGKENGRIPPPRSGYAAVAFSRDGTLLTAQDNQGVVTVWERVARRTIPGSRTRGSVGGGP